jgi:hypothetical protein
VLRARALLPKSIFVAFRREKVEDRLGGPEFLTDDAQTPAKPGGERRPGVGQCVGKAGNGLLAVLEFLHGMCFLGSGLPVRFFV